MTAVFSNRRRQPYEGGYVARYPELPGCITTGETLESAAENAADAKKAWLEAALEDGTAIPDLAPVKE